MFLIQRIYYVHDALEGRRGQLYCLLASALFLCLFAAMPANLTGLEDNVDGMKGYQWFYLAFVALSGLMYGLLAYGIYRYLPLFGRSTAVLVGLAFLFSAMVFGFVYQTDAGVLDNFIFAKPEALVPSWATIGTDAVIIVASLLLALFLLGSVPGLVANLAIVVMLTSVLLTGFSLMSIHERANRKSEVGGAQDTKLFHYSKQGKNVLLIFLDGSMTGYMPDIVAANPGLPQQFTGFTWYSNVVSTGNRTINGLPAVFGGFDYTVSAVNQRPGTLKEKVSNAYRIYADNFSRHGYQVLYSDPFWFGLERKGNCELFNSQYQASGQGRCIHSIGKYIDQQKADTKGADPSFIGLATQYLGVTLYKIVPSSLRQAIYGDGDWLGTSYAWKKKQDKYLNNYFSLLTLGQHSAADANTNTFTFMANEVTRATQFVGVDCIPSRQYSTMSPTIRPLMEKYGTEETARIYQTTSCAMQALGRYMQWMKSEGIYDNTMIVIASDHGWLSRNPLLKKVKDQERYSMFQSFLMVKPFNAGKTTLQESHQFIANANIPGMICDVLGGCQDRATGKTIRYQPLKGSVLLHETPWQPSGQTRDAYVIDALYEVSGDVTRPESWKRLQ